MGKFFVQLFRRFPRRLAGAGLALGLLVSPALAETPAGVALDRIVTEIKELKRLVYQLKTDEKKARSQRDWIHKHRENALRYSGGGSRALHLAGFVQLLERFEQSPGQASLLQASVPALESDNFIPDRDVEFPGGEVAELIHFCRVNFVGVRYGSRAQLVIAELARDVVHQADDRLAALDERIERYKAQNIAHTDLIGRLMHCALHCGHCHHCHHYGYGTCGHVAPLVVEPPIAGLNSQAYDTNRRGYDDAPKLAEIATDERRLKFLEPYAPNLGQPATADDQLAGSNNRRRKGQ